MNAKDRTVIGVAVYRARVAKGWGKEKAANTAGVSSITWKRVEDGLAVQEWYQILRNTPEANVL